MTAVQPWVAVSRRPLDLEDYINVARRHSGWIIGPCFAGLVISTVVAFSLPNVYQAQASMQITPSQVSETLVQSTLNQRMNERIEQMRANIESRASLAQLINNPALNLYKEEKNKLPTDDIVDIMKRDIEIRLSPETTQNRQGSAVFQIFFKYRTKVGARDTVNALIARFMDEGTSSQRSQQATLQLFFTDEAAQARADLEKQNELVTNFRKVNEGRLPEQETMNFEALHSLETQISGINQDLSRLSNDQRTLETQITYLDNQLKIQTSMMEDMESMPAPTSVAAHQNDELLALNKRISEEESQLQQYKLIYQPTYPDIRSLEARIKQQKKERDDLEAKQTQQQSDEGSKPRVAPRKITNFKALEAQESLKGEIQRYRVLLENNERNKELAAKEKERLSKEVDSYRARLAATSQLEATYQDLLRDQKSAVEKYEKYQHQKDLTAQNQDLISRKATENMETLDLPTTPTKPSSPNRPLIVAGGFAASLLLGLALAGVQEARDTSLKNLKDVRAYTNLPVLCSIPLLENTVLVKRKRRIMYLAWASAVIVGILAVGTSLFYYYTVTLAA